MVCALWQEDMFMLSSSNKVIEVAMAGEKLVGRCLGQSNESNGKFAPRAPKNGRSDSSTKDRMNRVSESIVRGRASRRRPHTLSPRSGAPASVL